MRGVVARELRKQARKLFPQGSQTAIKRVDVSRKKKDGKVVYLSRNILVYTGALRAYRSLKKRYSGRPAKNIPLKTWVAALYG